MADFVDSEAEESDVIIFSNLTTNFVTLGSLNDTRNNNSRGFLSKFNLKCIWCIFRQCAFLPLYFFPHIFFQSEVEDELEPHERKKLKKIKAMSDSEEEEDGKLQKEIKILLDLIFINKQMMRIEFVKT